MPLGRERRLAGTVRLRLTASHGFLTLPHPSRELGGLVPVPAGLGVLIDVGRARYVATATAWTIADAVRDADSVEVIGDDPAGVQELHAALTAVLRRLDAVR